MLPEVIVYTTHLGHIKDDLQEPRGYRANCRYVCITDKPLKSKYWKILRIKPQLRADYVCRQYKIPSCTMGDTSGQITLWTDCSFRLDVDPVSIVDQYLTTNHDMAAYKSPFRDNILDEASAILDNKRIRKQDWKTVNDLLETYSWEEEEFYRSQKTLTCGGFLVRRNSETLRKFEEIWFEEYDRWFPGCSRDIMTIDYAIWKSGLRVNYFEGHYQNSAFGKFHKTV